MGMVHMNGRVYDPLLGRFTSADPMTENPFSTQGWNRYSYVGNSPVNFTDPSGYCFLGCFWKSVPSAIRRAIKPYLGTILRIAVAAMAYAACGPVGPVCAAFASTVTAAFAAGVSGGGLGHMLKAAMITALTAAAFSAVGNVSALAARPDYLGPVGGHVVKIVGHGAVGCLTTAASGGSCSSGGISAGVAAAVTPLVDIAFPNARTDARHLAGGTAALAGIGGLASVAGGGKFQNGAVTAAFGYLINQLGSYDRNDPRYHYYELESFICQRSEPVCTAENVFRAMRLFPTPTSFYDEPVVTGDQSRIFGAAGTVTHVVNESNLRLYNIANPDHLLHPGEVERSIVLRDGGIYISTIGQGTGSFVSFNSALGPGAFYSLDWRIKSYLLSTNARIR